MTDRARQVYEDALSLTADERLELAEQLMSSVPLDREWLEELDRRAQRVVADPDGGEAWDVVHKRLQVRITKQ